MAPAVVIDALFVEDGHASRSIAWRGWRGRCSPVCPSRNDASPKNLDGASRHPGRHRQSGLDVTRFVSADSRPATHTPRRHHLSKPVRQLFSTTRSCRRDLDRLCLRPDPHVELRQRRRVTCGRVSIRARPKVDRYLQHPSCAHKPKVARCPRVVRRCLFISHIIADRCVRDMNISNNATPRVRSTVRVFRFSGF